MFCSNCGKLLDDDALFCMNCGNKVYDEQENKERISEKLSEAKSSPGKKLEKNIDETCLQQKPEIVNSEKKNFFKMIPSQILIVLTFLIVITAIFFIITRKESESHWVSNNTLKIDDLKVIEADNSHLDIWYELTEKDWKKIQEKFPQYLMYDNKIWYLLESSDYEEEMDNISHEANSSISTDILSEDEWENLLDFENPVNSEYILNTVKGSYVCGITNYEYYLAVVFSSSEESSGPLTYISENLPND